MFFLTFLIKRNSFIVFFGEVFGTLRKLELNALYLWIYMKAHTSGQHPKVSHVMYTVAYLMHTNAIKLPASKDSSSLIQMNIYFFKKKTKLNHA